MAEDPEDRGDGPPHLAVALGVLDLQPAHERLRGGQPHRVGHRAVHPPSTTRLVPVISDAAGDAA